MDVFEKMNQEFLSGNYSEGEKINMQKELNAYISSLQGMNPIELMNLASNKAIEIIKRVKMQKANERNNSKKNIGVYIVLFAVIVFIVTKK